MKSLVRIRDLAADGNDRHYTSVGMPCDHIGDWVTKWDETLARIDDRRQELHGLSALLLSPNIVNV
jgi:hypothetical protein